MAEQTPAQLREIADLLGRAARTDDHYRAYMLCVYAFDTWPKELEGHPVEGALSHLYTETEWRDNQAGLRWLAGAVQLRLLIDAVYADNREFGPCMEGFGRIVDAWRREVQHG